MRPERAAKDLNPSLKKRIAVYALAGAAGAVLASNANGAIVYTSVKEFGEAQFGVEAVIPIDLNHDGIIDFNLVGLIQSEFNSVFPLHTAFVFMNCLNGAIAASGTFLQQQNAAALTFGQQIGPSLSFQEGGLLMAELLAGANGVGSVGGHGGNFFNQGNKFLGIKLAFNGQTYYGWARVNVQRVVGDARVKGNFLFELVDYAYQDRASTPLRAGAGIPLAAADLDLDAEPKEPGSGSPATLGLLAYGSDAISAWRR